MRNYASKETEEPRAARAAQRHGSPPAAGLQGRRAVRRDGGGRTGTEYRHLDDQPAREGSRNARRPRAVPARPCGLHADARGADRVRGDAAAARVDGGLSQQDRRYSRQDGRRTARRGVRQDGHQPERAARRRDPPVRGRGARRRAEPACGIDQRGRARDHRRQLPGRDHSRAPQLWQPRVFGAVRRTDAAVLRPPASALRCAARQAHVDDDPQPCVRGARLPFAEHGTEPSCEAHAQRDRVGPGVDRDADPVRPLSRLPARPLRGKLRKQGADAADRAASVQLPVPVREPAAALAAAVAGRAAVPVVSGSRARRESVACATVRPAPDRAGTASRASRSAPCAAREPPPFSRAIRLCDNAGSPFPLRLPP
ncbi:hypothetical protein EMIT0111MI5_10402 [Burkholderia sp. IT-111MI5]